MRKFKWATDWCAAHPSSYADLIALDGDHYAQPCDQFESAVRKGHEHISTILHSSD